MIHIFSKNIVIIIQIKRHYPEFLNILETRAAHINYISGNYDFIRLNLSWLYNRDGSIQLSKKHCCPSERNRKS